MQIPGGRVYLVESTMSAKALRRESIWMLKGHNRGQCDGNGVGDRGRRQVLAMPGQVVQAPLNAEQE